MRTLTQRQINNIRNYVAEHEARLIEDVSNAEAFEYIEDMVDAEQLKQITTHGSDNVGEWTIKPIRTRKQIIMDIIDCDVENQLMAL